jgi:hypothetical protein
LRIPQQNIYKGQFAMNSESFYFRRLIRCLIASLILNLIHISYVSAQSVLDRLEQQIRQRVSPSEEGVPKPPPAPVPDQISSADQSNAGYLGVTADDRMDRGRGVRITEVKPGSPAEKAGFRLGDLVVGLMDVRVRQLTDMTDTLAMYHPGDILEFDILRGSTQQKLKATLGRRLVAPTPIGQTAERIPLPPGELILPDPTQSKVMPSPAKTSSPSDSELIVQLQNRIAELERRVAELERALSETRKTDK